MHERESNDSFLPRINISVSNTSCLEITSVLNTGRASTIEPLEIMHCPGLTSTGGCFPCLSQVNYQALTKTQWSYQCLEPVKSPLCPTHSISEPLKSHSVSVVVELWHTWRKSPVRLWSHIWSLKIPWSSPIFALKICAAGDPSLCLPNFFPLKTADLSGTTFSFSGQWTTLFPVTCLSGPPWDSCFVWGFVWVDLWGFVGWLVLF